MERFSKNREAILRCLQGTKSHPTAEWVYAQLKPEFSNLSLGTVYRNLTQLKESGMIRSLGVIAGEEHFDADIRDHHHATCRCCGKVVDLECNQSYTDAMKTAQESSGWIFEEIRFSGICPECIMKEQTAD